VARVRVVAVLAVLSSLALSACGGGDAGSSKHRAKGERGEASEQAEREAQLRRIPAGDRAAFYQVATVTGLLRERAALQTAGRRPRAALARELAAGRDRVRAVHPRDARLVALRVRVLRALAARRAPRAELAAADRIARDLTTLLRREPAYAALVPD
jgi:hypothetical protein